MSAPLPINRLDPYSQGHLISENPNGANQYTREYIYLGDQPIAVMK